MFPYSCVKWVTWRGDEGTASSAHNVLDGGAGSLCQVSDPFNLAWNFKRSRSTKSGRKVGENSEGRETPRERKQMLWLKAGAARVRRERKTEEMVWIFDRWFPKALRKSPRKRHTPLLSSQPVVKSYDEPLLPFSHPIPPCLPSFCPPLILSLFSKKP